MPKQKHDEFDNPTEEIIYVSKSEIKRDFKELRQIGLRLITLKQSILDQLSLTQQLKDAIETSHRITSHNARKRHLGYITKLLHNQNIDQVLELFERIDSSSKTHKQHFHNLERWRDRLINDNDSSALTDFLQQYPQADHQHIRQLIRNAKKELQLDRPPASARKLFKYIRTVDEDMN